MNKKNTNEHDANKSASAARFLLPPSSEAEKKMHNLRSSAAPLRTIEEILHELQISQTELKIQNDELRRTQAVLEESRSRYVNFYDFAPVGYITLDSDGTLEEINLTGATLLGEERGNLLHKKFAHFISPEHLERWQQHFIEVLKHERRLTCELALLHHDSECLQVRLDSVRLLRHDMAPVMRIAITDITERKRAEEAMREQDEFFRMITENIEDFIAVLDLEGRRLYNSPSYAKLFKDIESIKGTDSFAEVHPDDREQVRRVFMETVTTGTGLQIEYRFVLADGVIRYMESRGGLIKDKHGRASQVVVISRDITERKQAEEKILNLAFYDTLTQLPNRRMLDDRLGHAMAASKRGGHYCALMFLDLDNFKPLNDLYGHSVGDMLLKEVAHRISGCIRETDTVARFGGDEFIVMLGVLDPDKEASIAQARIVAEKIRTAIADPYILTIKIKGNTGIRFEYQCTSSIGVVVFVNHELSQEELLKLADKEMYQAKENGRNQICFHNN